MLVITVHQCVILRINIIRILGSQSLTTNICEVGRVLMFYRRPALYLFNLDCSGTSFCHYLRDHIAYAIAIGSLIDCLLIVYWLLMWLPDVHNIGQAWAQACASSPCAEPSRWPRPSWQPHGLPDPRSGRKGGMGPCRGALNICICI